jgi:cytochrome c
MNNDLNKNKILAAVLIALLLGLIISLIAGHLIQPQYLKENIYIVEMEDAEISSGEKENLKQEQDIMTLLPNADIEKGKSVVKKCVQCHSLEKNGPDRIGPNLWGIVGALGASKKGYAYSSAAKEMKIKWTYANLDEYLKNPRKFMPGTKMSFIGLKKVKDRANLIAYMRTYSDNPLPIN